MDISITNVICIITFLISYQAFNNDNIKANLRGYPYAQSKNNEWYRFITGGFIHADWIHLLINLFVLWQFGGIVEKYFAQIFGTTKGSLIFTLFYILALIAADIPSFFKHRNNPNYASLGASGAVAAVVFVFIVFQPWHVLWLYAILPIPAIIGAILYIAYSTWAGRKQEMNLGRSSGKLIGHDAHIYGALFGVVFIFIAYPESIGIFWERLMQLPF